MKIKDLDQSLRPREKALRVGIDCLSDQELLCLLIGSGTSKAGVDQLAGRLLEKSGQLKNLFDMDARELMEIEGIGQAKALIIVSALEQARRALQARAYKKTLGGLDDALEWFRAEYGTRKQEFFVAVYLDQKGAIIRHKVLFIGTINQSLIHPREIFKEAFLCSAVSMVIVHNHPSQDPTPSLADLETTKALVEAARICQIQLLDHIIVSSDSSFSFRGHELLD